MPLSAGTRLGPYEVVGLVGAGGMGEVYKARDTRLDRTVAIKVLPTDVSLDPDRRARFEREAKTIAGLTHPHICTLHDVGAHADSMFLVMEHLDGDTLARRLERGPLSIERALTIGTEVADALTAAHRVGIIHRDLKPGNIMLTKSGVKLLDFGLAKLATDDEQAVARLVSAPTRTSPLTGEGVVLGTLQYMAPEQLDGHDADARSDIFAFGLVLYEMVTGQTAFTGKTQASLISSIFKDEPRPIAELRPLTPPLLDHIIGRCLAKDPDERWQTASDIARELRWADKNASAGGTSAGARPAHRNRLLLAGAGVLAGLVIGIAATLLVSGAGGRRAVDPPRGVVRALVGIAPAEHLQALPADRTTTEGRPSRTAMAWSPDARSFVFSAVQDGRQQLYRRVLDQLAAVSIPGTDGGSAPFFSPDGRWIGFWSGGALKKTSMDGSGAATTICNTPEVFGASWGPDDTIVFARPTEGLFRVPGAGGTPESLARPDRKKGELKYLLPQFLPDGAAILFTVTHSPLPTWDDTEVVAQSLATGERTVVVPGGADGRYLRSGHLLYVRRGTLMAVPFDLQRLKAAGGEVAVIADVMQAGNMPTEPSDSGAGQFSVSESGSLLYLPGGVFPDPERSLVWVNRSGAVEPLPLPSRAYASPRLSSDGGRVVFWTQGDRNIWIHELGRGTTTKLTSDGRNARPVWTPDGTRVTFATALGGHENLFWKPADGSGPAERLTTSDHLHVAASWSPDGRTLAFVESRPETGYDIWMLPRDGDLQPRAFIKTRFVEAYPQFSPDGHHLAYASDESGRFEVYVQPYPGPGPRQMVSTDGGIGPTWSRDGRELFYTTQGVVGRSPQFAGGQATLTRMMVVPVTLRPTFTFGTPQLLFQGSYGATSLIRSYDMTADGQRFLMVLPTQRPPVDAAEMILVENWIEELKRLVPTR